jgi:hypothetical protein
MYRKYWSDFRSLQQKYSSGDPVSLSNTRSQQYCITCRWFCSRYKIGIPDGATEQECCILAVFGLVNLGWFMFRKCHRIVFLSLVYRWHSMLHKLVIFHPPSPPRQPLTCAMDQITNRIQS